MSQPPTAAQRQAVREAARWYARLASGNPTDSEQALWQRWHDASELHSQAWQRMQAVTQAMGGLPERLASATLLGAGNSRRQVLYGLALLLGASSLGTLAWRSDKRREWAADYRSGVGERRSVQLADGSQLLLDTDSAVDVQFGPQQRLLVLRRGRVLISTASDATARPFMVDTPHGRVLALGTRFTVSTADRHSEVAVLEKAVQVSIAQAPPVRLHAGQRVVFGPEGIGNVASSDASVAAWRNGSLIAIDLPLGELVAQLARYRPGILRCDPAVASLKVSGAFPINDTDMALAALQSGFPVQVVRRTRYWVTVAAQP